MTEKQKEKLKQVWNTLTDKEKAEYILLQNDCYTYEGNFIRADKVVDLVSQVLAEGRKERNCVNCSNHGKQIEVLKLKAQIEKMKCCENCKHSYTDSENLVFCYLPIPQEECKSCRIYNHKETENDYWELAE